VADSNINVGIINRVATITFGSPPKSLEEFNGLANRLTELCEQLGAEKDAAVIVLFGDAENAWDLSELVLETKSEKDRSIPSDLPRIATALASFNGPVIAAIKGDAVGLGLELALACDIRIAADSSLFSLPQIESGQIPWDGGTQRLTRAIGVTKAMEMILTGKQIDAKEAVRLDLINKSVLKDDVLKSASGMADLIAEKGPISLEYTKEAIHKGLDLTLEQGLRLEADLYYLLHTTRDRTEGVKAFQEKRKPVFKGE